MRILVDISEQQITELAILCKNIGLSRSKIIHRAIDLYIQQHKTEEVNGFGLWKNENIKVEDGLVYQKSLRNEW